MVSILKQDSSEIVLQAKPHPVVIGFLSMWTILASGLTIFYGFPALTQPIGVTDLACQRVEPKFVRCTRSQSQYFGLKPGESTVFEPVSEAKVETTNEQKEAVWVALITQPKKTTRVMGGFGMELDQAKGLADNLQAFLNSQESSLTLSYDNRFELPNFLFLALLSSFPLFSLAAIYRMLRWEKFTFDKGKEHCFRQTQTLLGKRSQTYALGEIKDIQVVERRGDDSTYHVLEIQFHSGKKRDIGAIDLETGNQITQLLRGFIGLQKPTQGQ
jgi:hypothetical protein